MMDYLNLVQINNSSTLPKGIDPNAPVARRTMYGSGTGEGRYGAQAPYTAPVARRTMYGSGTGVNNTSPLRLVDAPVAPIRKYGSDTGEEYGPERVHMPQ